MTSPGEVPGLSRVARQDERYPQNRRNQQRKKKKKKDPKKQAQDDRDGRTSGTDDGEHQIDTLA